MSKIIIYILLFYRCVYVVEPNNNNTSLTCAIDIIKNYAKNVLFIHTNVFDEISQLLMIKIDLPKALLFTEASYVDHGFGENFDFAVVVLNASSDLNYVLQLMKQRTYYHPNDRLLIICNTPNTCNDVSSIFTLCWYYYIFNVVVLSDNRTFIYFPYRYDACGYFVKEEEVGYCIDKGVNIFPDNKIPLVSNRCPLRLLTLNFAPYVINISNPTQPGIEGQIVIEVAKRLNFSINVVHHSCDSHGKKLQNGSYTELYKMIADNNADILLGMIRLNESDADDFDSTYPYLTDHVTWHLATALEISKWKNLWMIFEPKIWCALCNIVVLNCFTWWLFGNRPGEVKNFKDIQYCFICGLCVLLAGSQAKPKGQIFRGLFILWSCFSLLIVTAYQSQLISFLSKPIYDHQIQKGKDMLKYKLKFGYHEAIRNIFSDNTHKTNYRFYKEFTPCSVEGLECVERAAIKRDFAILMNRRQVMYLTRR